MEQHQVRGQNVVQPHHAYLNNDQAGPSNAAGTKQNKMLKRVADNSFVDLSDNAASATKKLCALKARVAGVLDCVPLGSYYRPKDNDGKFILVDFDKYLHGHRDRIQARIQKELVKREGLKVQLVVIAEYEKLRATDVMVSDAAKAKRVAAAAKAMKDQDPNIATMVLNTKLVPVLHAMDIPSTVAEMIKTLKEKHVNMLMKGSDMAMRAVVRMDMPLAIFTPLAGSSYLDLPAFLLNKKCIMNVQNDDQRCFGYALLSALHPIDHIHHPQRASKYDHLFAQHGLDALNYPVQVEQLEAVERQIKIAFNVYTFFDDLGKGRKPIYTSKTGDPQTAIDLLFWERGDVGHFAWIKNFEGFVKDLSTTKRPRYWCKKCFCSFHLEHVFDAHRKRCLGAEGFKCIHQLPTEDKALLKFENVKFMERVPFVIYADFESITKPVNDGVRVGGGGNDASGDEDDGEGNDVQHENNVDDEAVEDDGDDDDVAMRQNKRKVKNVYQHHVPISVGLKLVSAIPGVLDNIPYETYTGEDVADWFLNRLLQLEKMCTRFLFDETKIVMTPADQIAFNTATECYICHKTFPAPGTGDDDDDGGIPRGMIKVRDHDHISGQFRGAAHSRCNLFLRRQRKIPVFMHNFRGYDSHLVVPALGNYPDKKLNVIAQTLEKYLLMNELWRPSGLERLAAIPSELVGAPDCNTFQKWTQQVCAHVGWLREQQRCASGHVASQGCVSVRLDDKCGSFGRNRVAPASGVLQSPSPIWLHSRGMCTFEHVLRVTSTWNIPKRNESA